MRFRDQNQNNIADDPGGQCGGHHAQKKRRRTVSDYSSETSDECDENCKFLEIGYFTIVIIVNQSVRPNFSKRKTF